MTTVANVVMPTIRIDLDVGNLAATYRRFAEVVGARAWTKRVLQIKVEIKGNPFLAEYLRTENDIAFALQRCGEMLARHGQLPESTGGTRPFFPALGFAAQTLSMMDVATRVEGERLRRRVHAAFANPDDMRAYRLELAVATHFVRHGWHVSWPEMMRAGETFDVLATSTTGALLEIECKTISDDKGRRIHHREALEFCRLVAKELATVLNTLTAGLAVVLTVPTRLPTGIADRRVLAKRIREQVHTGSGARLNDGSDIRISEFDPRVVARLASGGDADDLTSVVAAVTGTQNREGVVSVNAGVARSRSSSKAPPKTVW